MPKKRSIFRPIITIALLSILIGGSLGIMRNYSKEQIEINLNNERKKAVLYALNISYEDQSDTEIDKIFKTSVLDHKLRGINYYVYRENGVIKSYCFPFKGKGLWGSISGYMAVDSQAKTLLGIVFTEHSETPGLGGRIDELWFKEQFRGLDISQDGEYITYSAKGIDGLDSITGATVTSDAVKKFINSSLDEIRVIVKEDLNE